jgi:hypothetical protein
MPLTRRSLALSLAALALSGAPALAQYANDDYDNAEQAIISAGRDAARVARLRHVAGISAFNMRFRNTASVPFEFDRSPQQLGIAAERHAGEIAALRAALRKNPATASALAAHGIPVARVVGVRLSFGGWLTVYFQ